MEDVSFLSIILSIFFLLTVSVFTYILSKKINFPYTVLLILVGILLIPLVNTELFSFIGHFKLSPDLLFYVFLPILIFESAYNINYRQLLKNWKTIGGLAVVGLMISAIIVASILYLVLPLVGFDIPFLVCFLFGSLISSTDPVAVLSIFKSLGAPKRLSLLFEGESLFNDGTSLALFTVILGIILSGGVVTSNTFFGGIRIFISTLLLGFIFGGIIGIIFSKIIQHIKNNELVEITLSLILAHMTFIFAELITHHTSLYISGIIATATAGIILGNYGKYKISPKVESHMNQFWELFAFISNSLVFILMGLILYHVDVNFSKFIIPVIITILIIIVARIIGVIIPISIINKFKLEENTPKTYITMLSWGSLRGAISLIMVMMIPGEGEKGFEQMIAFQNIVGWNFDFSIKDFLIVLTIGSVMFTLFIKAPSISILMKKLGLTSFSDLEKFEYQEGKILTTLKMHEKIKSLQEKNYLSLEESQKLKERYENEMEESVKNLKKMIKSLGKEKGDDLVKKTLSMHSLGIEKQYLKDLFVYNEISEKNYKYILDKINRQIERLESGKVQLKNNTYDKSERDIFQKICYFFEKKEESFVDEYTIYRAKAVVTRKVIKELKTLSKVYFGFDKDLFDEIISLYEHFNKVANERKDEIHSKYKTEINYIESKLVNKSLFKLEENIIEDLYSKEMITSKLYIKFKEEIEKGIMTDIKKIV